QMRAKLRVLPFLILLLPFDLLVAFAFAIVELVAVVGRRRGRNHPLPPVGGSPPQKGENEIVSPFLRGTAADRRQGVVSPLLHSATIIIVNWDGKHLLSESLPAVIEAVQYAGGQHEVLVVDNGST